MLDADMLARGRAHLLAQLGAARAVAADDAQRPELVRLAHALVSSAVVFGYEDLSRACVALESAADAPDFTATRRAFLAEVERCLSAETSGGRR